MKKNSYLKNLDKKSVDSRNKTELYSTKCAGAIKSLNSIK